MSTYNLEKNNTFITNKTDDIANGKIVDTGWRGFLDALGCMENRGGYEKLNSSSFHGIYQVGDGIAKDLSFFAPNGIGFGFLGIKDKWSALQNSPNATATQIKRESGSQSELIGA